MTDPSLRRFALTLHYDGAPFHGWQLQPDLPTVQGAVEEALERLTGVDRRIIGSGRTDSGVHALGQVASVDLPPRWSARELRRGMNALLPSSIWVAEVRRVPDDFHPRYGARARSYLYRIGVGPHAPSPFFRPWCWDLSGGPPPPESLHHLATLLPGERSFAPFAKAGQPERGTRCRVTDARWVVHPEGELRFHITADRYLHHMVRYLVGTQVAVAAGERPAAEWSALLNDPEGCGLTTSPPAPPHGLFLARVEYLPEEWEQYPDRDPAPAAADPDTVAAPARSAP